MAKKALLIGINKYKSIGGLRGCENDVTNMRHLLMRYFGFRAGDISLLIDRSAVKARITKRINWLFKDAKKDDELVFHFSGHGSYIRDFDGDEEDRHLRDHVDELICLHDMDWRESDSYMIDDELGKQFDKLPEGAKLTVILDCCHSGTGTRSVAIAPPPGLAPVGERSSGGFDFEGSDGGGFDWGRSVSSPREPVRQPRFVPPPLDIELRSDEREPLERVRFARPRSGRKMNHILLAGCRDDQTSADAHIGGAFNGAFTYYLCKAVRDANGRIPYRDLIGQVRHSLRFNNFMQVPQLEGPGQGRDFLS